MAPSAAVVSATDPETVPETEMLVDAVTSTVPTESVVADAGPSYAELPAPLNARMRYQ